VARIVITGFPPLLADGLRAALVAPGWQVDTGAADESADAVVMPADERHEIVVRGGDARVQAVLGAAATPTQLLAAVAAVLQGLAVRDPALGSWAASASPRADHEPLTPRELEVFELVGKGLSNRDIAGVLGISAHTAKFHVGQILAKVGAATRAEAVSAGLRLGLIGL